VTELDAVLDDVNRGVYHRDMVGGGTGAGKVRASALASPAPAAAAAAARAPASLALASTAAPFASPLVASGRSAAASPSLANGHAVTVERGSDGGAAAAGGAVPLPAPVGATRDGRPLYAYTRGEVRESGDTVAMEGVPLCTPNGDVLVPSLTFAVHPGQNVLIAGPNGSGKTAAGRTLARLWPLWGGVMTTPPGGHALFYIPQKPYLPLGTLRDLITYPHSRADMVAAGRTDDDLRALLGEVALTGLVERYPDGFDAVDVWNDVCSGGEKQRLALARMFYHRPRFCINDEATSAVSVDVEGALYARARERGITLLTVSHRKTLWRHHEWLLQFDGHGGYVFKRITDEDRAAAFGSS
jgi:ABC-type Mn2+/Zn2+ transport system ATPase subunit